MSERRSPVQPDVIARRSTAAGRARGTLPPGCWDTRASSRVGKNSTVFSTPEGGFAQKRSPKTAEITHETGRQGRFLHRSHVQQSGAWMENMASFPDLRPHRRSAKAERGAASRNRARTLLAVSTALLFTASLAVSEFATLRGAKAHDASAFLTRELGPPLDSATLVRTPARKHSVKINGRGFVVRSHGQTIGLASTDAGAGSWRRHEHGVWRKTPFGVEAI